MAYQGNQPAENYASFERQVFTIVNSQTAYTLTHAVTNENDIRLVINSVVQEPGSGKAYTAANTTLTLSAALVNGTDEMYCVYLGTKSSDPTQDNDGDALAEGMLYFNSTTNRLKFYDGSAWQNVEATDTSSFATKGFATAMSIAL